MKPDARRKSLRLIEEKRPNYFLHVFAKLFPSITFRYDGLRKALGAIAAIGFLNYFKNQLIHAEHLCREGTTSKSGHSHPQQRPRMRQR
jgi:hypothetical protein